MTNFAALQTALSGLLAHQRSLQTAGHNAANVGTDGYSRRRVDLVSAGSGVIPAVWSKTDGIGRGVDVAGMVRIRDEFLEARALREAGTGARLDALATATRRIEMVFPEPSDVGLARQLSELWGAFEDVANQPGSNAPRVAVLERARIVADELNRGAAELANLHGSAVLQATTLVEEVNATAARVAELNGAIRNASAAGLDPHDLADQRDLLVERLGELVGVTTRPGELGTLDVFLGGSTLVRGDRFETLQAAETTAVAAPHDLFRTQQVQWAKDGYPAVVDGGEIGGLIEAANVTIPGYLRQLDDVASQLATAVNAAHAGGYDLDGAAGLDLFTGTSASDIRLNPAVGGDPRKVAASGDPAGTLDGGNANALAALGQGPGSADSLYGELIGRLGVESQALHRRQQIQTEVIVQVDAARDSVKGVNLDEELTALVQAQHAYAASARLMTAVDEMLETLIGRTGLVGR